MKIFEIMHKEGKIIKKCVLPQCKVGRGDVLHKFPRKRLRWLQWLSAVHLTENDVGMQKRAGTLYLCNKHFRNEDYLSKNSKILLQTAVPTLNLNKLGNLDRSHSIPDVKICSANSSKERRSAPVQRRSANSFRSPDVSMTNLDVSQINERMRLQTSDDDICEVNHSESTGINRSSSINPQSMISSTTAMPMPAAAEVSTSGTPDASSTQVNGIKEEYMGLMSASSEKLKIYHNLVSSACNVDAKWLRGQCHCSECFDTATHTFRIDMFDSITNILPVMATILDNSRQLEIVWSDNHTSKYDLDLIVSQVNSIKNANYKPHMERLLWSTQHTKYRDDFKPLHFQDIMLHKHSIKTAIDRLQRSGILLIDTLPETQNDITMKKLCITKLFNCSMDNIVMERRYNFIGKRSIPHTNCTFESIDKNIQIITASNKTLDKIQLVLVDGFNVAQQMQNRHTSDYTTLKTAKQIFTFKHKQNYLYSLEKSVLAANSEQQIERILFSPYHMTDIKHQNLDNFSPAMSTMSKLFKATENQWCIDLSINRLLVLDNYRICWNLKWQDESRPPPSLDCYYIERKHFLSCLYTLNLDT